jgi:cytochrome c biogenesis protein CcmG, thiol:disulfide interchange protein DsbE
MRRLLASLIVVALTAAVIVGLGQAGSSEEVEAVPLQEAREPLAGAPAPLAALHADAARLLGGKEAFEARLRELRGYPVVINRWGSWCGPCRSEFPILSRQATEHGKRVAFLGIDFEDGRGPAEEFLAEIPVPYPSYEDPAGKISASLDLPRGTPTTIFLDREGKVVGRHFGEYRTEADMRAEIDRYTR